MRYCRRRSFDSHGIYEDLTEGQYPVKENEILLSNGAKELLSVNIGDVITMHTRPGILTIGFPVLEEMLPLLQMPMWWGLF